MVVDSNARGGVLGRGVYEKKSTGVVAKRASSQIGRIDCKSVSKEESEVREIKWREQVS